MSVTFSRDNIELAWHRSLRGENADYRALCSLEIDAFAWADKAHILQIQKELRQGTYSPCEVTRLYQPKPTGLLRPITILRVPDVVVYQTIANVIAEKAQKKFRKYYYKQTFSNILYSTNRKWFFKQYRYGYNKLNLLKKTHFQSGKHWLAEIDLTSFYDLIDHETLRTILANYCSDQKVIDLLFECIKKWTIHGEYNLTHSHGIPQGPLPSAFFAECVLHLLDETMVADGGIAYLRYVDNITLMADTERELIFEISKIDIKCRELGLVAKIKTSPRKLKHAEEVIFSEPSEYQVVRPNVEMTPKQVKAMRRHFLKCFDGNILKKDDPNIMSKLSFCLFRMSSDKRLLNRVFRLFDQYPSLSSPIAFHLQLYGQNDSIFSFIQTRIDRLGAYEFVQYNCLKILFSSAFNKNLGAMRVICLKYLTKQHASYVRAIAATILGELKVGKTFLLQYLKGSTDTYVNQYIILALSNFIPASELQTLLNLYMRKDNSCVAIISSFLLTKENLKLTHPITGINPWSTPILHDRGLIQKTKVSDRIAQELVSRHPKIKKPGTFNFHKLLKDAEYKVALNQLKLGNGYFHSNPALWITHLDNFHQTLLVRLFELVGVSVTYDNVFGSINSNQLKARFPSVSAIFAKCHVSRCNSEIAHVYARYLGSFSSKLKYSERDSLYSQLHLAYQEIIDKS